MLIGIIPYAGIIRQVQRVGDYCPLSLIRGMSPRPSSPLFPFS